MSSINITDEKKKKKREFSLEQIASAINCGNMISSIRNKYIDPLIIRRKNILPKIKIRKLKCNQNNDPYSLNKMLLHEFIKKKQSLTKTQKIEKEEEEEEKAIQTKNNTSNKLFPLIPNNNSQNFNNQLSRNSDLLLITSGMFKQKEYCKDPIQKVKLGNILSLKYNSGEHLNMYPKIENVHKINERYNLQLDLKHLNSKCLSVKKGKKLTKKGLMNNLYKKYMTSSSTGINAENLNDTNSTNKTKKRHKTRKASTIVSRNSQNNIIKTNTVSASDSENNTVDVFKNDFFSEDKNTFITKLNVENEDKKEKKGNENNKKRIKLKKLKLFENNKDIIKYDQKVTIDCLRSKVKENIEHNKLIYKHINKTTFEAQKEPGYKKVKKFESIIDNIIKTKE